MTGVWGGIFAINFTLSSLAFMSPHAVGWIASPLTYLVLIAGIIFTIWYPGHEQKKHAPAVITMLCFLFSKQILKMNFSGTGNRHGLSARR